MIADDPKKLEQLNNHYYDPEFEEWLEEFDEETQQTHKKPEGSNQGEVETEEYETPLSKDDLGSSSDDWEVDE